MSSEPDQPGSKDRFLPASDNFELQAYPFYWITRLSNLYTHDMEKQLKKQGMNSTAWQVSMILKVHGKSSMTDIATHAEGRLSTINKVVYRLQDQGIVKVERNELDARVTMVSITDEGRELVGQLIESTSKTINRALTGMSAEDISTLNVLTKRLFDNLS